jgi:hypothetical protein
MLDLPHHVMLYLFLALPISWARGVCCLSTNDNECHR